MKRKDRPVLESPFPYESPAAVNMVPELPPRPVGRVFIRYEGMALKCDAINDEIFFTWLFATLRFILAEKGNNPATQLILEYTQPIASWL